MTETTYTIIFEDETEMNNLTFEETDKAMEESMENGNPWIRIFPDNNKLYKTP